MIPNLRTLWDEYRIIAWVILAVIVVIILVIVVT